MMCGAGGTLGSADETEKRGTRAESREQRAESRKQRMESEERRAESGELRTESGTQDRSGPVTEGRTAIPESIVTL